MISGDVGTKALDAAQQFGKIVNHPAPGSTWAIVSLMPAPGRTGQGFHGNRSGLVT